MRFRHCCIALALVGFSLVGRAERIEYEIHSIDDAGKPTPIGAGAKEYADSDFLVEQRSTQRETHWSKELELENGFRIGVSSYREPVVAGFGLWAKRSPCGFSWEWFDATDANRFAKRQEGGGLLVTYTKFGSDLEISRISFESDVSLRLNESPDTLKMTHRVLIKAGSVLKLPPSVAFQKARTQAIQVACAR